MSSIVVESGGVLSIIADAVAEAGGVTAWATGVEVGPGSSGRRGRGQSVSSVVGRQMS